MTRNLLPRTAHLQRPLDTLTWRRQESGETVSYMIIEKPGAVLVFSRTTGIWTAVVGTEVRVLGALEKGADTARKALLEMLLGVHRTNAPVVDPTSHAAPMPRGYVPGPCAQSPATSGGGYVVTSADELEMDLRARTARWLESNGLPTRLAYNGLARVRTIR